MGRVPRNRRICRGQIWMLGSCMELPIHVNFPANTSCFAFSAIPAHSAQPFPSGNCIKAQA